jgi:hypothetical protein
MFEASATAVTQIAARTNEACILLRIGLESAHRIMERAVERNRPRNPI